MMLLNFQHEQDLVRTNSHCGKVRLEEKKHVMLQYFQEMKKVHIAVSLVDCIHFVTSIHEVQVLK